MSSIRTRSRKPSRLTLTLVSSVTVLAAFASGATGAVLANPVPAQAPAHPATHTASSVAAAGQPLAGNLAAAAGAVRGGRIVLATLSGASHPHARRVARRMMHRRFHWSVRKQYRYVSKLWNRESGWNRFAYNPSSGAYGIPQAVPGSKMSSAGKHWRWRARTQIKWGLGYIKGRYRTPRRAWEHEITYGWY